MADTGKKLRVVRIVETVEHLVRFRATDAEVAAYHDSGDDDVLVELLDDRAPNWFMNATILERDCEAIEDFKPEEPVDD